MNQTKPSTWKSKARAAINAVVNRWTGGAVLMLLVVAWFAGMPSGELRLASFPAVANDAEKVTLATTLFQRADAALADAETYHRKLSFDTGDGGYNLTLPPPAAPGESGLEVFVEDLKFSGNTEAISAKFNLLAILKKSYEWFGLHDYFVVIREIELASCPSSGGAQCWRVVAQYWPSLMRPDEFIGTKDELAKDLAVLVLRGVVRNQGDEWRRVASADASPPFLMTASTPKTMDALEAAARGMAILELGLSHPDCMNKTVPECISFAQAAFRSSIKKEGGFSPVAAYGQALIELDFALGAARKLAPELTVEKHLSNAERLTSLARQSEFLRSIMDHEQPEIMFGLVYLHGLVPGDPLIGLTRRFACALADYRRANWDACLSKMGDLSDFPEPLRPYLEAARLDSALSEATGSTNFDAQLAELKRRLASFDAGTTSAEAKHLFVLRLVLLKHACRRPTILDDDKFIKLARAASSDAPQLAAHQEAIIYAAGCRPGQIFPSDTDMVRINEAVEAMAANSNERSRFELLLSQYLVRKGELDKALDFAKRALRLPWTGAYVRKAVGFAALINSAEHRDEFIEKSFTTAKLSDLESCPRLE